MKHQNQLLPLKKCSLFMKIAESFVSYSRRLWSEWDHWLFSWRSEIWVFSSGGQAACISGWLLWRSWRSRVRLPGLLRQLSGSRCWSELYWPLRLWWLKDLQAYRSTRKSWCYQWSQGHWKTCLSAIQKESYRRSCQDTSLLCGPCFSDWPSLPWGEQCWDSSILSAEQ